MKKLTMKKRITFEEWKARKDKQLKPANDGNLMKEGYIFNDFSTLQCLTTRMPNETVKTGANQAEALSKSVRKASSNPIDTNITENSLILKESGSLTFHEWLHNKNVVKQCEARRKEAEEEEKKRRKREREETVEKAYNIWLIRNKHRNLEKYYSQLGEDKIKEILLEDINKLGLKLSKDVGVGERSIDYHMEDVVKNTLTPRKQQN